MRASGTAVCIAIAMLAGCSKAPDGTDAPAASDTAGAPGIAVTAAPGVAFNYRYGFRLPPRAIAAVQEAHASTCEKLGIARCRITGMDYRVVGENDIRGSLRFKLDPAIARAFGKRGIDIVQDAKGTLVSAEITGTDAAEAIERAGGTQAEAARDAAATAADNRASLARTPMTFDYESGDAVRGFDTSAPLTSALDTMVASGQVTLAVLLGIVAIFGPPAIVFVIGLLLWRRMRRPVARWRREADD